MQGTVLFFQRRGGWGFITGSDDEDYFVHHSSLIDRNSLKPDQRVEFDQSTRNGKPLAVNVRLVAEASDSSTTHDVLSTPSSGGAQ